MQSQTEFEVALTIGEKFKDLTKYFFNLLYKQFFIFFHHITENAIKIILFFIFRRISHNKPQLI